MKLSNKYRNVMIERGEKNEIISAIPRHSESRAKLQDPSHDEL